MRVTEALVYNRMGRNNTLSRQRLDKTSLQLMTGRSIERPSDDPLLASRIEQANRGMRRTDRFRENIAQTDTHYRNVESTVATVVDQLSELSELAISMVSGAMNADNKSYAAEQVTNILQSMRALGNMKYDGKYIFSGRLETTPAYDDLGNYQGDAIGRTTEVTDGYSIQADMSGLEVFGDPGAGATTAFQAAENLRTGLLANDNTQILAALEELQAAHKTATGAWSVIGYRLSELQQYDGINDDQKINYAEQEADLVGADYAKAASEMQFAETVYQASLATSSRLMEILKMEARL